MKRLGLLFVLFLAPLAEAQVVNQGGSSGGGGTAFNGGTSTLTSPSIFTFEDAATNTVTDILTLRHTSSGSVTNSFGTGLVFSAENASGINRDIGYIRYNYLDSVNATEDGQVQFGVIRGGAQQTMMTLDDAFGLSLSPPSASAQNRSIQIDPDGWIRWWNTVSNRGAILTSPADNVIEARDGATGNSRTPFIQCGGCSARVNADVPYSNATFGAVTGLTTNVISARKYAGRLMIRMDESTTPTSGFKLDFNGGSATMTSFWAACAQQVGGALVAVAQISTSLAGVINYSTITGDTYLSCDVSFVPSGSGTFIPRMAQNAASGGTLNVRLGTYWNIQDIP